MRYWMVQILMWLLWPLWVFYSIKRCRKQPNTWLCFAQLWTIKCPEFASQPIWIHAVSLGETQTAFILIKQLKATYPNLDIFFTGGNKSAIEYAQKQAIDHVQISFLPIDYLWLRRRLFRSVKPKLLVLMETEFWPNLLKTAHQQAVPVAIIQARLSLSSRKNYPKYGQPLLKQLLSPVALVAAQTKVDAEHLIKLGIKPTHCHLLGNIKYDISIPPSLYELALALSHRIGSRWIWTAGSTHPNEEIPLLAAHKQLSNSINKPLLILVPRHPSYFKTLIDKLSETSIEFVKWSDWYPSQQQLAHSVEVLVVDTLGQLMLCYQISQVCFVGGSLVTWGGHNLIEPAILKKSMIAGPHNHNFLEIEQGLIQSGSLSIVHDETELLNCLRFTYENQNLTQDAAQRGYEYIIRHQGATQKIINELNQLISQPKTL